MMNTTPSSFVRWYKYLLVFPLFAAAYFFVNPVKASNTAIIDPGKDALDLKAFEGYYQFDQDKDMYLQISAKEHQLLLKQLWDGKEIPFEQQSALTFYNTEHDFPIVFSRDEQGAVIRLLAFGRDVWKRVKDYHPVIKKEVQLPVAKIHLFEGLYQLKDNTQMMLQFTAQGNHLVARELWSQKEIEIVPESPLEFFGKNIHYPVRFVRASDGTITSAIIFNRDTWQRVKDTVPKKQITLDAKQLKAFEGKYRFEFEKGKESFMQIAAQGNGLLLTSLWDGKEIFFVAESPLAFFSPERRVTLQFTRDEKGKVTHALAFNKDLWEKID